MSVSDRKSGWGRLGWATLAIVAMTVAGTKAAALVDQLGGTSTAHAAVESPLASDGSRSTQQLVGTPIGQVRLGGRVTGSSRLFD